jgi:hypothetical protein
MAVFPSLLSPDLHGHTVTMDMHVVASDVSGLTTGRHCHLLVDLAMFLCLLRRDFSLPSPKSSNNNTIIRPISRALSNTLNHIGGAFMFSTRMV